MDAATIPSKLGVITRSLKEAEEKC